MKKNLEYYQHFVNSHNHPKFKTLRLKYGWEGEGKFWALNNLIALSEECKLNLNLNYNKAVIATDLNFNNEEFDEFLKYLSEECNLIINDENVITTNITQENYIKVNNDRIAARERKNKGFKKNTQLKPEHLEYSTELSNSSPELNKKPNKIKENEIKENKTNLNISKENEVKIDDGRILLNSQNQEQDQNHNEEYYIDVEKLEKIEPSERERRYNYFDRFWKLYYRREGDKNEVFEKFYRVIDNQKKFDDLIEATMNYNNLTETRKLKFLKLPINFLDCYQDFLDIGD